MKKSVLLVSILIVLMGVALSGCQDTKSITSSVKNDIYLESSIVKFANVTMEKTKNKSGVIEKVTVIWLLQNIAKRTINAKINVKFYDKNNNFLYNDSREILYMPAGYIEKYVSPGANRVIYDGPYVSQVDHVIIAVTEI